MITGFRHKGLKALYEADDASGIRTDQAKRLRVLLARLDVAQSPSDMDLPGSRLHLLRGDLAGRYAVNVSGNWRLVFRFDSHGNVVDLDLIDYH